MSTDYFHKPDDYNTKPHSEEQRQRRRKSAETIRERLRQERRERAWTPSSYSLESQGCESEIVRQDNLYIQRANDRYFRRGF